MRIRTAFFALPALLAACGEEPPLAAEVVRPVRVARIGDTAYVSRWVPGVAQATQEVNTAFEVGGRLIERFVKVGDTVLAGDALAQLDPSDYQNEVAAALAQLKQAQAYRDRIAEAADAGAVALQDLTDADAQLDVAQATLEIKQKALDDTTLHAPFSGTVASTFVENFQNVQAKEPVIRLIDLSRIEMVVDLPEGSISLLPYLEDLRCRFEALGPTEISAEVHEVSTEASATTRTFPITLIMDQPDGAPVRPGMSGEATGTVNMPPDAAVEGLIIPVTAVVDSGDGAFVWVVEESSNTVRRRGVVPGELTAQGIYVSGVEVGELLVTAGAHYLVEAQRVTPFEPGTGAGVSP